MDRNIPFGMSRELKETEVGVLPASVDNLVTWTTDRTNTHYDDRKPISACEIINFLLNPDNLSFFNGFSPESLQASLHLGATDSLVYDVEDQDGNYSEHGEAVIYFAPEQNNLIFQNPEVAREQFTRMGNHANEIYQYKRSNKNVGALKRDAVDVASVDDISTLAQDKILKLKISDLELLGDDYYWGYFVIDTSKQDGGLKTNAQKAAAQRVYGSMQVQTDEQGNNYTEFGRNMERLNSHGRETATFFVLKGDHFKHQINSQNLLVRGSALSRDGSAFYGHVSRQLFTGLSWLLAKPDESRPVTEPSSELLSSGIDYELKTPSTIGGLDTYSNSLLKSPLMVGNN